LKSQLTTLCYIEKDNCYLMLHRTTKENDENHDKWIGIGGHFEFQESPEDCLIREVKEETGLSLLNYDFRGIVTFISDDHPAEYMHLYTSNSFSGTVSDCKEGQLEWIPIDKICTLNLWAGDRLFLDLLSQNVPFFSLKLVYKNGQLLNSILNGKQL